MLRMIACGLMRLTKELTDAGGQWRPKWKLTRSARVRSSDLVRQVHSLLQMAHSLDSGGISMLRRSIGVTISKI